jgi:hypothetical protein
LSPLYLVTGGFAGYVPTAGIRTNMLIEKKKMGKAPPSKELRKCVIHVIA